MKTPGHYQTETSDMIAVHQALLGSLDAAPTLVAKAVEDPARTDAIGSFFENVLEFLHVHHAGEDELIYPRLEERCAENKALLERIDEQHTLLYEPMEVAAAAIDAWRVDRSEAGGRSVVDAIAIIDQTLRPHLSEEELTVLPLASAWMSQEEWAELPIHAMRSFRGDKPWLSLGLIMENIGDERREAMLARMPPERQALWRQEWGSAFGDFITEIRR
jgi:hemerythrin-like domain-containing protein